MSRRRLVAGLLLALLLAPGTWLRTPPARPGPAVLRFVPLALPQDDGWPEGLQLSGGWQLAANDPGFGGFSALLLQADGRMRGFTDFGSTAQFPRPRPGTIRPQLAPLPPSPAIPYLPDVESAVQQPDGALWLGYENHNALRRIAPDGSSRVVRPAAMRNWGQNSGPEAMARLADGRFLVLAERGGDGLLFPGDPLEGRTPTRFRIAWPGDFRPTDMALLPDGRVLLLLRAIRWRLPPFATMLALADPAAIRAGRAWPVTPLAVIDDPAIAENYEGLAVEPAAAGALTLWLISDDNRSALQRSLLLRFSWQPHRQTAREGTPREPRESPQN